MPSPAAKTLPAVSGCKIYIAGSLSLRAASFVPIMARQQHSADWDQLLQQSEDFATRVRLFAITCLKKTVTYLRRVQQYIRFQCVSIFPFLSPSVPPPSIVVHCATATFESSVLAYFRMRRASRASSATSCKWSTSHRSYALRWLAQITARMLSPPPACWHRRASITEGKAKPQALIILQFQSTTASLIIQTENLSINNNIVHI